jgi:hypothetical protein
MQSFYFLANVSDLNHIKTSAVPLVQLTPDGQYPIKLQCVRDMEWNFPLSQCITNQSQKHSLYHYCGDSQLSPLNLMHQFRSGVRNNFELVSTFTCDINQDPMTSFLSKFNHLVETDFYYPSGEKVWRD